jgi:predicted membrane channel-forming protein YqfA (hemolysin III family)
MWELYKDVWTLWSNDPGMANGPQPYIGCVIVVGIAAVITAAVYFSDNPAPVGPGILGFVVMVGTAVAVWPVLAIAGVAAMVWKVLVEGIWYWVGAPIWTRAKKLRPRARLPQARLVSEGSDE